MIVLFLSVLPGCFLYRPSMKLNGFVSDARTGKPVGGARIRVGELVTYTKETGAYLMKVHREPRTVAEVAAPGYETAVVTCEASTKRPVCDLRLVPIP